MLNDTGVRSQLQIMKLDRALPATARGNGR
jgi:hypothetical protein